MGTLEGASAGSLRKMLLYFGIPRAITGQIPRKQQAARPWSNARILAVHGLRCAYSACWFEVALWTKTLVAWRRSPSTGHSSREKMVQRLLEPPRQKRKAGRAWPERLKDERLCRRV